MADGYDRFDNEGGGGGSFVMGLLTGTVLGAGLGMLFAPKAGSELRNQLAEQAGNLANTASEGYRRASRSRPATGPRRAARRTTRRAMPSTAAPTKRSATSSEATGGTNRGARPPGRRRHRLRLESMRGTGSDPLRGGTGRSAASLARRAGRVGADRS